jgi:hypothetical protein
MNEDDDNIMAKTDLVEDCVRRRGPISARDVWQGVDELPDYTHACAILNSLRKQGRVLLVGQDAQGRNVYCTPPSAGVTDAPPAEEQPKPRRKKADVAQLTHSEPEPPPTHEPQATSDDEHMHLAITSDGELTVGPVVLSREHVVQLARFLECTAAVWDF